MKLKLFVLMLTMTAMASTQAQDMTVSPTLDTTQGLVIDQGKPIEFEKIPMVQNTLNTDAAQQLKDFIKTVKSATGQFVQKTIGDQQKQSEQSGVFAFARPGKFIWHVTKPYEQQVISNGKSVFQYDPDLRQVTERNVNDAVGASPASILFGTTGLDESFTLQVLPKKDSMVWIRATPKVADSGFRYMDIGLANNLPSELLVLDSFGKTTIIKLHDLKANAPIDSSRFQFKVPQGVDHVKM